MVDVIEVERPESKVFSCEFIEIDATPKSACEFYGQSILMVRVTLPDKEV
jgi:hypothetical protein